MLLSISYNRYYYQYDASRLSTCLITVHGLLHIADSIEATGPVWTSWAFPMERFCGRLRQAVKSRRFPDASIAQYLVGEARLNQIQLVHNMSEELLLRVPGRADVPGQLKHDSCKHLIIYNGCN
jgi:hypothetical protein